MNKQSSFWFAVAAVALGVLLAVAAVFCGFGLSDTNGQKLVSAATAAAAVVGFVGLLVLVVYTRETFLLRKVAEEQNESTIRPIVRLDFRSTNDKSTDPTLELVFRLENVGSGPALKVRVQPIVSSGHDIDITILEESLIESKCYVPCRMVQGGSYIPGKDRTLYFVGLDIQNKFPESLPATIEFQSLSGRRYRTSHEILWDNREKILRTELRSVEVIG
jgi:hypothetical protein